MGSSIVKKSGDAPKVFAYTGAGMDRVSFEKGQAEGLGLLQGTGKKLFRP